MKLSAARDHYYKLLLLDQETATNFALSIAPKFANNQFFFMELLSKNNKSETKLKAAISAINTAKINSKIHYKILMKSIHTLEEHGRIDLPPGELNKIQSDILFSKKSKILAEIYYAKLKKRWSDACALLEKYIEKNPKDIKRRIELGVLAYRNGDWGKYYRHIQKLKEFPENISARTTSESFQSFLHLHFLKSSSEFSNEDISKLQSPASIFEHILESHPKSEQEERKGIAMISPSLAGGGAERITAIIYREMSKNPENIELALYEDPENLKRDKLSYLPLTGAKENQIKFLDMTESIREPFSWLPPNLAQKSQAIYSYLAETRPRILYLTLDMPNLAGGLAGILAGVPVIILHSHNMRPTELYGKEGGRLGWARAYRALLARDEVQMLCVSKVVADDYQDWIGLKSNEIKVVRNGLDLEKLMEYSEDFISSLKTDIGIKENELVVGTAIRFEEVKQPELWLKMAKHVAQARPDVHFVLFGEGELLDKAKRQCRDSDLKDRVHFMGHVNDLYRRLALLDIFVLSSRSEGLPNVLLEAQVAGAVPIAFDVGGCGEAMIDGTTGLLVSDQSDRALADAVLKVLEDQKFRNRAKRAGKSFVRRNFSVKNMMTGILKAGFR